MNINITIKSDRVIKNLQQVRKRIHTELVKETKQQSRKLTNYTIQRHLTGGTTSSRLKVRSNYLRSTTVPYTRDNGKSIVGGVQFGAFYASMHVGAKGKITTIRPKNGKRLAIPLKGVLTAGGRYRGDRTASIKEQFPNLSFIRSKAGKSILADITDKGTIIPYFVLVKQAQIKTRIHPEEILRKNKASIEKGLRKSIQKVLKSVR